MNRPIIGPRSRSEACLESGPTLDKIGEDLGSVPNIFLTAAHSPAALTSLWSHVKAAEQMRLDSRLREMIALRVAQSNGCSYCLAAHTAMAEKVGIDQAKVLDYRRGISDDERERVLLDLVTKVVEHRGHHSGFEVEAARRAGFSDREIVEAICLVGLYTYLNYLDCVANSEIDFPPVEDLGCCRASRR